MEKLKVLILGHNGMLGHMVKKYFEKNNVDVFTTDYKWPSKEFEDYLLKFNGDFIINCIGSIPQKTNDFYINYGLPIWMSNNISKRIVHPGTDCEMDDDQYGISKKKASDYIKQNSNNTKILKTSIIGPEVKSKSSLMEWFLNSDREVKGYKNALWNGITTLEWAKSCLSLLNNWESYKIETIVEGQCLSKYDLLKEIQSVFDKNIDIIPFENERIDKCLCGEVKSPSIHLQLLELKDFYYNENS